MTKDLNTSEITELKKKLDENPDSLVFAPLADAFRKNGGLEEALIVCKKGLEKHPNYTSARVVLGRIYQEQKKIDQATIEFKKVLETDPENLMAHSFLGAIYVTRGDCQSAIEEYQKILTLNPDDEETQQALKQAIEKAASEQKTNNKTLKDPPAIEKKVLPKESTASLTIADLYLKQGHFDKAIEVFQELLANDPQNLMLRQKLVEVVDRQKKEISLESNTLKLKKNNYTQPPDHKEDLLEEPATDLKRQGKGKKDDDTKFTSDDILQVMRRGGKDDVVIEEKPNVENLKIIKPSINEINNQTEKKGKFSFTVEQIDMLKVILSDLGSINGIMRCFITGVDGTILVSVGEVNNNQELTKQSANIFENTNRSVTQLNQGKLQQVLITADLGHILLLSFSNFVLIVLANNKINLGLLRLALDTSVKKIIRI